jgi:hypothetical protein
MNDLVRPKPIEQSTWVEIVIKILAIGMRISETSSFTNLSPELKSAQTAFQTLINGFSLNDQPDAAWFVFSDKAIELAGEALRCEESSKISFEESHGIAGLAIVAETVAQATRYRWSEAVTKSALQRNRPGQIWPVRDLKSLRYLRAASASLDDLVQRYPDSICKSDVASVKQKLKSLIS